MVFPRTYAELHTPDGSQSEMASDHNRKYAASPHSVVRRLQETSSDLEKIEEGGGSSSERLTCNDKLSCGGMLGTCPIFVLTFFIILGTGIGVGVGLLLSCQGATEEDDTKYCIFKKDE